MPSIDLKDINGIGSKTVETLKAANIRTIKQLSTISVAELESLDGIGPAKAKQFINEAKKKLNSTDGRTQLKDQSFVGPKRSILQEINAKIEKIHSRLENFDRRIEFIGNNLDLSREGNRKGEEDRNIRKTSALTQLKAEIINEIKDPEFFKNLIKEGIQNYLQKDQLPNKNQEIKTEKLMQLQEQVKILEQKFSSLATSFKSQQWSDKGDESSSAQAVERKNKPPIELKTSVDLEAATNTLTKPKKAPLQKSKTSDKKNASEPQVTIKKPIQNLEGIEKYIKYILEPGDSIEVDRLIRKKELQNISLSKLKQAIYTLIEEEIIIPAESSTSVQKIDGSIGKLTRVK